MLDGLTDDSKAVRVAAVQRLVQIGEENIPARYKNYYNKALEEHKQALLYNADFPTGKINLANYYYYRKEYPEAEKYFKAALAQDQELFFCESKPGLFVQPNRSK